MVQSLSLPAFPIDPPTEPVFSPVHGLGDVLVPSTISRFAQGRKPTFLRSFQRHLCQQMRPLRAVHVAV